MTTNRIPDFLRRFSVPIALFWLGLAVVTNVFVPQLETVAESHNVSLSPQDSPSLQAANVSARCSTSSTRTVRR